MPRLRVALIFGGKSVEHEISLASARSVAVAVKEAGHEPVLLGITRAGRWLTGNAAKRLLQGQRPEKQNPTVGSLLAPEGFLNPLVVDVAFPLIHGLFGEDGSLQGLLEMAGLPYVGSGVI